jgi:hypothetical protein
MALLGQRLSAFDQFPQSGYHVEVLAAYYTTFRTDVAMLIAIILLIIYVLWSSHRRFRAQRRRQDTLAVHEWGPIARLHTAALEARTATIKSLHFRILTRPYDWQVDGE